MKKISVSQRFATFFPELDMGMDHYLLIPFLGGWTSIYQLFWCSPGVQGFDTLPYAKYAGFGSHPLLHRCTVAPRRRLKGRAISHFGPENGSFLFLRRLKDWECSFGWSLLLDIAGSVICCLQSWPAATCSQDFPDKICHVICDWPHDRTNAKLIKITCTSNSAGSDGETKFPSSSFFPLLPRLATGRLTPQLCQLCLLVYRHHEL